MVYVDLLWEHLHNSTDRTDGRSDIPQKVNNGLL